MTNPINPKLLFLFWAILVIFIVAFGKAQFSEIKSSKLVMFVTGQTDSLFDTGQVKGISIAAVPISIEVFRDTGQAPFTVLFNAVPAGSNIATYEWNFGDSNANEENPATDQGRMVGHRFDNPGIYTVTLTVSDVNGDTGSATKTIFVDGEVGNTYYISASASGSGNGLSEGSPWNVAQLVANSDSVDDDEITPGSRILFKRGETFGFGTEWNINYLTRAYPYITIGAYGTDEHKPIITSKINTNEPGENKGIIITDIEVTSNIWIRPKFHSAGPVGFWSPGLQATLRNVKAVALTVWESNGVVLENILIDKNYTSKQGILIDGHKKDTMEYIYVKNIEVKNALGHCVYFAGGGNNILIENNNFHDCGIYTDIADIRDGLTIHGNSDNVVVRYNDIHHNGYAFGFDSAYSNDKYAGVIVPAELMTNFLFENNKVYDHVSHVSQIRSLQNSVFRNNIFYNNSKIIFGIYGPKVPDQTIGEPLDFPTENIEIYNNTFYNNSNTNYYYVGAFSPPNNNGMIGNITIKNNIISNNTGSGNRVLIENAGSSAVLQFSNNIYFNLVDNIQFNVPGSSYTLDTWLASGKDPSSLPNDPLFFDPAAYNFELQDSSPAINAGANINNAYDYLGQIRTAVLDIGAYENLLAVPPCEKDWYCDPWSDCVNGNQTRTCTDSTGCEMVESQTCSPTTPTCQEDWTCEPWNACVNNQTTRACVDENDCGTFILKPAQSLQCAPMENCQPSWGCSAWGACEGEGYRKRFCSDNRNCGTAYNLPIEIRAYSFPPTSCP